MSKQHHGSPKQCLQCGSMVHPGGYCNEVYVKLDSGRETLKLLHGGPCVMKFIDRIGIDILRMAHPVIPAAALG